MVNSTGDSIHGNKVSEICHFYMEEVRMTTGFPSKVYYVNFIVALVFNIFLTISTIFLNSVTILAYMKSALLKSKKAYFLIMLLSVNDLLVGLFGEVSFVILLVTALIGFWKCEVYIVLEFPAFCLTPLSIMTLFGLNICSRDAKRKQEFSSVIGCRSSELFRQPITLLNSCFRFASREQIRLVENGLYIPFIIIPK